MDQHHRLRLASRINHLLLRELGEGVDVAMLLKRAPYAAEVLYVCAASANPELRAVGEEFAAATRAYHEQVVLEMQRTERDATPPGSTTPSSWAPATSDFGSSLPAGSGEAPRRRATAAVKSGFTPWST